jgi:hypothetical protein
VDYVDFFSMTQKKFSTIQSLPTKSNCISWVVSGNVVYLTGHRFDSVYRFSPLNETYTRLSLHI